MPPPLSCVHTVKYRLRPCCHNVLSPSSFASFGCCARKRVIMTSSSGDALFPLADSHCHAQMNVQNHSLVQDLKPLSIAAMSVSEDDWPNTEKLYRLYPNKVIPSFGVHPWWAHLHALNPGDTFASILDYRDDQQLELAIGQIQEHGSPSAGWEPTLRQLLGSYPTALVAEIGLDRAAVIPGTKVSVKFSHQLELFSRQLAIAAEFDRPVSIHCVRAHGHLLEIFLRLSPDKCPPRIMMHSYGGDVQDLNKLLKLKRIGNRFYFGFSYVINSRQMDKLVERIQNVPDDRLLLESDHIEVAKIDQSLQSMLQVAAQAKGWSLEHAQQQTFRNHQTFYGMPDNQIA